MTSNFKLVILSNLLPPSVSSQYVIFNLLNCVLILILVIWSSYPSLFVSRLYVNLVICLNTPHLIILSHLRPPSPACTSTWSIVYPHLMMLSHTLPFISRKYVDLVDCFKTSNLIILHHPLRPSPASTSIRSIIWISLIWSSRPISFIRLQVVRGHG